MANPQKDNGYTPVANEIVEKVLLYPFTATQLKIILACWRYSYGFSKKNTELSETFLSKATSISKRYISKELNNLISLNIIKVIKNPTFNIARIVSFNKDYETWNSRTTVPQVNYNSTDEPEQDTTVEPQFHTTVELEFHQQNNNKTNIKTIYSVEFENFWTSYPRKVEKAKAYKCWNTRLSEKCIPEDMIKAAVNYAAECKVKDKEKEYIKHPSTFLSNTKPFEDFVNYTPEPEQNDTPFSGRWKNGN